MSQAIAYSHSFPLPWDVNREDRQKLKVWLMWVMLVVLAVGLPMPWLPVPEVERQDLETLPPQLARILQEKPKPVIPPPPPTSNNQRFHRQPLESPLSGTTPQLFSVSVATIFSSFVVCITASGGNPWSASIVSRRSL